MDILDEKDDLLDIPVFGEDVEEIFYKKREKRNRNAYRDSQPMLIRLAAVFCIAVLIAVYFLMPGNKVYALSISGNRYLSKKYIQELCGITN
ncbi:MAG: hypothetical protein IIZ48_08105, partial [Erysipelotrichales bacterium]|nr:hypothetical protein [Erysipelotrichales bacterium]